MFQWSFYDSTITGTDELNFLKASKNTLET